MYSWGVAGPQLLVFGFPGLFFLICNRSVTAPFSQARHKQRRPDCVITMHPDGFAHGPGGRHGGGAEEEARLTGQACVWSRMSRVPTFSLSQVRPWQPPCPPPASLPHSKCPGLACALYSLLLFPISLPTRPAVAAVGHPEGCLPLPHPDFPKAQQKAIVL